MYAFHAKSLSAASEPTRRQKAINEFVAKLTLKLPTKEIFLEKFSVLRYSDKFATQKRDAQYVVTKLFSWMFPAVAVNPNEMSIEHIEPQSSAAMSDAAIASIGNLWFLKTAFNNSLGNAAADQKLLQYKAHQLPCDVTLRDAIAWTATEIERRTVELGEQFWAVISQKFALRS